MTTLLRYFISGANADWLDLGTPGSEFALVGQQFIATGSATVNTVHAALGVDLDARNLLAGEDVIVFNYRWDQYTKDISSVSGAIVFSYLDSASGLTEKVTVLNGATTLGRDRLIFADGAVLTQNAKAALATSLTAALSTVTGFSAAAGSTTSTFVTPTPAGNTYRAFASTTNTTGQGALFAMAEAGQTLVATGSSQVDKVYVKAGAVVDARNLLAGEDVIYLTGNWADYSKSLTAVSGAIQFTRTINGVNEVVTVLNGATTLGRDKLVFADGAVLTQNAKTALTTSLTAAITAVPAYDATTVTAFLSDIQAVAAVSSAGGVAGVHNASDEIVFTVTMKSGKNVDVTTTGGTPRLAITLDSGATAYATFDSTLSGGTTNLSALKFKYVVADGQTDSNGISLAANALSLNGGAIKLYNTTTDAKITTAALADQATYKVDTTAPGFVSAATNGSGSKVILTYAETLDATTATADAFTVKVNGTVVVVSSVAVNASTVELALATPAQAGQTVTVGYAAPAASASASNAAVQDAAGNDAATLAVTTAVTNNAGDVTPPSVTAVSDSTSASVTKDPISFSVTFSEALAADPTTANFTATNGSVSSVSKVDSTHYSVVVTPTSNMASGTVALSLVGGSLKDAAGNAVDNADLSGFDAQGIDTAAPAAPSISTASATINSTSQTIAGTAEANSTVSIFDGSTQLGTATANGSGAFSYSATGLSQAAHSITAKATDAAGNVSAASSAITLTVDTTAPTVTSIAYGTNDGNLALGEAVTLIANMSEAVTVTGTPTLALANGATASYTAGTGTSTLTFSYTPAAGQTTTDLATATTAALTGTIADAAGNAVVATGFNNVNPTGTLAVDVTAPVYQSAASSVDGSKVILTYSESLSATTAATGAFAVTVAGSTRAVSSVAVSGSTVELTLASAIANGQTVTVAYTDPTGANDANAAQDLAGNDAATLAATAVVNNVPLVVRQDPVLLIDAGVYTATSGVDTFVIDASQYMAATINGFAVGDILQIANRTPAQGINILDSTYGNGQTQLTAGVAVITLNGLSTDGFAPSEAGFESTFGTNAIQYNDANAPSFMGAYTSTNGLKIGLQFFEALSATTAAANAFAVNVAGVSRAVSSVAVSGTTVELTLASAVAAGQNVTVAYTAPANSALPGNAAVQDASGNDVSALSAQPVTNLVPANGADSSAPTLVDTVVLQDGSILLTFSESILTSTLENADFSVALAGNAGSTTPLAVVATAIKGVANHQVLLTLERPVRQADGVYEVAYKNIGTSGSVHDTSGNAAVTQSMSGADILNLSTADTPGAVEIAGTPTQGQTLSAQLTDVDGVPANVTYQWFAGTVAIANSNASSLALTQAQIGQAINVQASYIDASGHVATVSGIATAGVSNAQLQGTVAITGTQVDGGILTAALSDPDGVELGSSSFQWYADGSAISGAVSDSFTVTSAYVSKQISVSATYIDGDNVTATVIGTPANRPPAGTLGISGTLEENQTLTAINQITDLDGIGTPMIYQWKASTDGVNWSNIAGATTGSLVLSDESLVGKYIQVLASYTDNNGHAETVTANAGAVANRYAVVNNVNDAPLVSGVANAFLSLNGLGSNGQPDAGEVLSVNTTGIADPDGLGVFSFQWFIDNSAVTQLTSSNSYTVPAGNTGKDLYASVVYVDGHGTTETLMTQNPATHLDYVIG